MADIFLKINQYSENKLILNLLSLIRTYYNDSTILIKNVSNLPNNTYYINKTGYLEGYILQEGNYYINVLVSKGSTLANKYLFIKATSSKKQKSYLYKVTNARNVGFIKFRDI